MLFVARGHADADETWRRFTTPATWPTWAPHVRAVETEDAELRVGSTGRVRGAGGVAVEFRVDALDPALRSWSWTVGRGRATVRMDHHVVPAFGGGSRAILRILGGHVVGGHVPGGAALLTAAYRPVATAALRGLVRGGGDVAVGAAAATASTPPVERFAFAFAPSYVVPALAFGVRPASAYAELGPDWLYVRYGPWRLVTPRANIATTEVTGGFRWLRTAGPAHLSLTDHGVSFTTNGDRALCVTFHEPVPVLDPTGGLMHPNATLAVAEPARLARAIGAAE